MRTATAITLVTAMGFAASPVMAQDTNDQIQTNATQPDAAQTTSGNASNSPMASSRNREVVSLPDWHPDVTGANVQSIEALIDEDVIDANGEDIGDVENVMFDAEGKAVSIVAEVGGVWDIGDTHVSIPWSDLEFSGNGVIVPVTEDTIDEFSLFETETLGADTAASQVTELEGGWFSDVDTGPRVWRAAELIDDYARYQDDSRWNNYGYVDDILVDNGSISAVVVRPDRSYGGNNGLFAYPFYGYDYGWSPGLANYDLPYDRSTLDAREPMEGVVGNAANRTTDSAG
ncbi:PRC-barrel domain-containing protein [Aurantimonas sp. 22II-16-19i]|uniref:PRC-barrel domain-containing protein n=1 Tax=Aurantimonas sp. 22II-16-19i TaxID=1317114 RepID=UPI0009F7F4C4|nr:PRC-barrel domain-containing protein [Aurantimonas sp. 22II-16-19i]ORE94018.1 hypothetical protein ATO4_14729 [Aurantimonas sp. 22II-16-19i]